LNTVALCMIRGQGGLPEQLEIFLIFMEKNYFVGEKNSKVVCESRSSFS
jgi:hypothetical protein